jgi:hypothetical protein
MTSLLKKLHLFPGAVLVGGCQRSGTSIAARCLSYCGAVRVVPDDLHSHLEINSFALLSGYSPVTPQEGRYVFQVTYLDHDYVELMISEEQFSLIWCLRNPFDVVRSMLHNWWDTAIYGTLENCGYTALSPEQLKQFKQWGSFEQWDRSLISRVQAACAVYLSKLNHAYTLKEFFKQSRNSLHFLQFERFIQAPEHTLHELCDHLSLQYSQSAVEVISPDKSSRLPELTGEEHSVVESLCRAPYERALLDFFGNAEDIA